MGGATVETDASVDAFIDAVPDLRRRGEARDLRARMAGMTGLEPRMWGPSMIGFGRYRYKYDSGHSGVAFRTGFAPRAAALVLYILPGYQDLAPMLARLGPHRAGKSCLYLRRLDKVDGAVLDEIIRFGWARMAELYPD